MNFERDDREKRKEKEHKQTEARERIRELTGQLGLVPDARLHGP